MPADYQQEFTGKSQVLQLLLFMNTLFSKQKFISPIILYKMCLSSLNKNILVMFLHFISRYRVEITVRNNYGYIQVTS